MKKLYLAVMCAMLALAGPALAAKNEAAKTAAPSTSLNISVVASGDAYKGDPQFGLIVNGKQTAEATVTSSFAKGQWQTFNFNVSVAGTPQTVGIDFLNDLSNGRSHDRNLYIKDIAVNGTTLLPSQGTYRGAAGVTTMYWSGIMNWNVAKLFTNTPPVTPLACGSTPSGSTVTQTLSTTAGTIAATTAQCTYGGTQPTTTTVTQVELCTNGVLSNQGSSASKTVNNGNPICNPAPAPLACGSTPSGSTVTQTLSTTAGTIAATTAQCTYGGTQPTTTTVTQVELCTNGVLSNQGSSASKTVNNGNPICNPAPAPLACGSTPSGSTVTQTLSTTAGTIAATAAQCPNGGTVPTTTTVTQLKLCTNGTLSNDGSSASTTTDGTPVCNAPTAVNGACGSQNGLTLSSAPTTNLCTTGTASAISGSGPWNWSCTGSNGGTTASCEAQLASSGTTGTGQCIAGSAIPSPTSIIMPPSVPQPSQSGDIVGVILQNASATDGQMNYATFGQIFANGAIAPGTALVARIYGTNYPVQMDALALWPNGSVKLAAITLSTANICSGTQVPAMLAVTTASESNTPVSLTNTPITLTASLTFTSGGTSQTINLGSALKLALTSSPNYWLQGPLATQARVDVPVPGTPTMHITADVTAYADGSVLADVQFNNDITTTIPMAYGGNNQQSPLPKLQYKATVSLQSQQSTNTVSQDQYTDWHVVLASNGAAPMFISPSTLLPLLNVQHDLAYLEHAGAILPYDRTTGVDNATLQSYAGSVSGGPLAINGVTTYMPTTGGRGDIGYTTQYNTVWLLTGDARAAAVGLAQSDTSGSVPWNMKLANGRWLTPYDDTNIWTSSDQWSDSILNAIDTSVWMPDPAHEPNLNYVPYIMTGARWNLDRLNAQAAFGLSDDYTGYRCKPNTNNCTNPTYSDIVLNGDDQVRYQGWSFREIKEASFAGAPGSFEESYFSQVVTDNWSYIQSQEPAWAAAQGQATGWLEGAYGTNPGAIAPWEEDYFEGIVELASEMGDAGARQFLAWQHPWLTGRFNVPGTLGMNPNDGCAYNLVTFNGSTYVPYSTWTAIETATVGAGDSQGAAFNSLNNGDYCPIARAALGGALTMYPTDAELTQALSWLNSQTPTASWVQYFQADPTFNVVPLQ